MGILFKGVMLQVFFCPEWVLSYISCMYVCVILCLLYLYVRKLVKILTCIIKLLWDTSFMTIHKGKHL